MNIPDAPLALRPLLQRLAAEAETEVTQHAHTPAPDEWFAGRVLAGPGGGTLGGGDFGPYASAEDAIVRLVAHLWERYDEVRDERDRAAAEASELRAELARVRSVAGDAGAELLRLAGLTGRG